MCNLSVTEILDKEARRFAINGYRFLLDVSDEGLELIGVEVGDAATGNLELIAPEGIKGIEKSFWESLTKLHLTCEVYLKVTDILLHYLPQDVILVSRADVDMEFISDTKRFLQDSGKVVVVLDGLVVDSVEQQLFVQERWNILVPLYRDGEKLRSNYLECNITGRGIVQNPNKIKIETDVWKRLFMAILYKADALLKNKIALDNEYLIKNVWEYANTLLKDNEKSYLYWENTAINKSIKNVCLVATNLSSKLYQYMCEVIGFQSGLEYLKFLDSYSKGRGWPVDLYTDEFLMCDFESVYREQKSALPVYSRRSVNWLLKLYTVESGELYSKNVEILRHAGIKVTDKDFRDIFASPMFADLPNLQNFLDGMHRAYQNVLLFAHTREDELHLVKSYPEFRGWAMKLIDTSIRGLIGSKEFLIGVLQNVVNHCEKEKKTFVLDDIIYLLWKAKIMQLSYYKSHQAELDAFRERLKVEGKGVKIPNHDGNLVYAGDKYQKSHLPKAEFIARAIELQNKHLVNTTIWQEQFSGLDIEVLSYTAPYVDALLDLHIEHLKVKKEQTDNSFFWLSSASYMTSKAAYIESVVSSIQGKCEQEYGNSKKLIEVGRLVETLLKNIHEKEIGMLLNTFKIREDKERCWVELTYVDLPVYFLERKMYLEEYFKSVLLSDCEIQGDEAEVCKQFISEFRSIMYKNILVERCDFCK